MPEILYQENVRIACRYNDKDRTGTIVEVTPHYIRVEVSPNEYRTFLYPKLQNVRVVG